MSDAEVIIVAMRVSEGAGAAAGSTVVACARCGAAVWCAPSSARRVAGVAAVKFLCVWCVPDEMAARGEETIELERITDAQRAELRGFFGKWES